MRKKLLLLLIAIQVFSANAQEQTTFEVEKSINQIQLGPGLWFSNETIIGVNSTLRTEIGLDLSSFKKYGSDYRGYYVYLFTPGITLEPRNYYNIQKRGEKGKRTEGNSANYFSLKATFYPNMFTLPEHDEVFVPNQLKIMPMWGIRRDFNHLNFEFGAGIGGTYIFQKSSWGRYTNDKGFNLAFNLHARIGYRF